MASFYLNLFTKNKQQKSPSQFPALLFLIKIENLRNNGDKYVYVYFNRVKPLLVNTSYL